MATTARDHPFAVTGDMASHAVAFDAMRFDHRTDAEAGGQLVCCTAGGLELHGQSGEWIIPADHMVFVPARRMFRLRAQRRSSGVVIKFCRNEVAWPHDGCWVAPVDPFAARMIDYALRLPLDGTKQARSFFVTLGAMLPDWFSQARIMWTPYGKTAAMQRVIDYARRRGPAVTLADVAGHAGMSERTLRRRMHSELGLTWRAFIREVRMNRAMAMLREERRSVTETAFEVGFSSSSAFSNAFCAYVGKTPSAYARSFKTAPRTP